MELFSPFLFISYLQVKRGRVMLLTTHSMEEADILGDKIAIMRAGRLASVGTSIHLKNRFGTGYGISILAKKPENVATVKQFVAKHFKKSKDVCDLTNCFDCSLCSN